MTHRVRRVDFSNIPVESQSEGSPQEERGGEERVGCSSRSGAALCFQTSRRETVKPVNSSSSSFSSAGTVLGEFLSRASPPETSQWLCSHSQHSFSPLVLRNGKNAWPLPLSLTTLLSGDGEY